MSFLQPRWSHLVDVEQPDAIRKGLELVWGVNAMPLSAHAPFNYLLGDSKIARAVIEESLGEVRLNGARDHEFDLDRLERALYFATHLKMQLLLVVRFYEGLYFTEVGTTNYPIVPDGNYIKIPSKQFHEVRP